MNDVLTSLLKLQALEFSDAKTPEQAGEMAALRTVVPQPILGHYDRLVARGKKGVAIVRNQVCTGCHMRLPIGTINTLMQNSDIQLCDTCGRYLYLPEPAAEQPATPADAAPVEKPAKKPRKRKVPANAAV